MRKIVACVMLMMIGAWVWAQDQKEGYEVHDMKRPQPAIVTPGTFSTQEEPGKPPSDAVVLFDGKDLSKWKGKDGAAEWKVENGYMEIVPGTGQIATNDEFGDCQIHVEWMSPPPTDKTSQARGNSGVFLMGLYELQVLDNYQNETYPDGAAGSVYGQYPPLANPIRPPGEWNIYDAVFRAAKVDADGKVTEPAHLTLLFNGVVVQDSMDLIGPSMHGALTTYPAKMPPKGPVTIQDHHNAVRYRNIWIRPLGEKPKPPVKPAGKGH